MNMKKGFVYLRRLVYVILTLYGVVILLTSTYVGTRALFAVAEKTIPGHLSVGSVRGSLTSGLLVNNLTYRNQTGRLQANNIALRLDLASLLNFHIFIRQFEIDDIAIYQSATDKSDNNSSDANLTLLPPTWLKFFDVDNVKITNVNYYQGMNTYTLSSASINQIAPHHYIYTIHSNIGNVKGSTGFSVSPRFTWDIDFNLSHGETHLALAGKVDDNINLKWSLNIPDLNMFNSTMDGRIYSNGSMNGTLTNPVINARVNIKKFDYSDLKIDHLVADINTLKSGNTSIDTTISAYGIDYDDIKLSQARINIDTRFLKSGIEAYLSGHLDQITRLSGTIKFNNKIKGHITLDASDLSQLPVSIPQVTKLSGKLSATLDISGKPDSPDIALTASLKEGSATIPITGANLTNAQATLLYKPNHPLELNGHANVGAGIANVTGRLNVLNNGYDFILGVKGENLQIANTHEYKIIANPDLTLNFTNDETSINGSVFIPKAKIYPVEFSDVVSIPDETTFVHKKTPVSTFYNDLVLDIDAKLGEHIHVRYQGLKTRLQGNVRINKSKGGMLTALGTLNAIHGSYKAYGTDLNIQTGHILYTGNPITNPGLDVRATKEIRKVGMGQEGNLTVGININGTANKPTISFFSSPGGLSQKDILSYLLFGYPQSQVSSASGLALLNSVAPGGSKASNVTDSVQKILGLSELGVSNTEYINPETKATNNTSTVNAGKKITKDLSIHYSVGLLYPISVLNIIYQINRHLSFQAETSTIENGADLVYSLERK